MKINIEGNLITTTADSELHVVISGARGPQGEPSPLGVPYTGATQDVNLGEFGLLTGNIEFDNTPTNVPTTDGSMSWSDTDGTVNLRLKGGNVISKLGETQHLRVYNNTGVSMAKGKVVYVTGSQGQRLTVALADADTELLSKDTIGITAEAIADQREGFIIIAGVLTNISTTGFLDGDTVFLSQTAGGYTKIPPADPAHLVILGFVVKGGSGGAGSIYVKVDNGYELEELHNVSDAAKTSIVDADAVLLRDSADNNLWKRLTWSNLKAAVKTYLDTFKGVAGGYASLDGSGKVPASELPSYVDDVIEVANYAALPVTGETGKIYITIDNNKSYRWSGSVYIEIAGTPAWGAITGTLSNQTDLQNALNAKQNTLTFDSAPTNGSTNPVTSDGVFDALALKQDTLTNPVTGTGASGQVSYWSGTNTQTGSNNLFWDAANSRLWIGTNPSNISADLYIRNSNPLIRLYSNSGNRHATIEQVGNNLGIGSESTGVIIGTNYGPSLSTAASNSIALSSNKFGIGTGIGTLAASTSKVLIISNGTTSATTALLVQNSTPSELFKVLDNGAWNHNGDGIVNGSTSTSNVLILKNNSGSNAFRFTSDGLFLIGSNPNRPYFFPASSVSTPNLNATALQLSIDNANNRPGFDFLITSGTRDYTSGNVDVMRITNTFSATSGTGTMSIFTVNPIINQTGGANGITRGLYVNPTLTAAADWRGIESVAASNANHTLLKLRNSTVDVFTVKADSKIGFFNAAPVVQPTTGIAESAFVENSGGTAINVDSTFDGYTVQQVVKALKDIGILG